MSTSLLTTHIDSFHFILTITLSRSLFYFFLDYKTSGTTDPFIWCWDRGLYLTWAELLSAALNGIFQEGLHIFFRLSWQLITEGKGDQLTGQWYFQELLRNPGFLSQCGSCEHEAHDSGSADLTIAATVAANMNTGQVKPLRHHFTHLWSANVDGSLIECLL